MPDPNPLTPGFMVVHGNRPDDLRALLAHWLRAAPLPPLEDEVVLVQSNGIAQWLKLQLADSNAGLGIAAALRTQLPSEFTWRAYRQLLGAAEVPRESPFDKPRLLWRVMRLLPGLVARPEFGPLRRFLQEGNADSRKLYQLSQRVADLFDQYQVYRADWLDAWSRGSDTLTTRQSQTQPLGEDFLWQPALWRALREDAGAEHASRGRAQVHERFLQAARDSACPRPRGLPKRVTVFGVSSLPQQSLDTLAALARWCQVLLYVHNPCRHDWSHTIPDHELLRSARRRQRPRTGPDAPEDSAVQPLLAAWGRQGRDFIRLLDEHDQREGYQQRFIEVMRSIDCFESHADAGRADTLLRRLQDDILELRPVAESRTTWPAAPQEDASLSFHVAHGPQREVEILQDCLLAALAADATLSPRDIIVMVPDVSIYAPHIQAVFGQLERDDPRYIPFGIADRGQRQHDPMLGALEKLLALPHSRLAVSDVLDLLDVPAVQKRAGVADTDLPLLHRWVDHAKVRWGLHAEQRASLGLPDGLEQNSWAFGLRRMFLGYAAGSTEPWNGVAPMDEIGGLDAALLGPLSAFIDGLDAHWRELATPGTPIQWGTRLRALLAAFFEADDGSAEGLTLLRLQEALQDWLDECAAAGYAAPLPLDLVAQHWLERIEPRSLSRPFFSGGVTFASLMPMRAIPFRWIGLLGMNDGDYPRSRTPSDFDLMARDYRPGDRSRREDDRYLFLEALLSARDHLHISWVGRSIRDNEPRPASVLVAQLRDQLAACWRLPGDSSPQDQAGAALLASITTEHRLQPFHASYFDGSRPVSYAQEWRSARAGHKPEMDAPLPAFTSDEPLSLRSVMAFARAPVRFFFNERLRVHFAQDDPACEDQEPFSLDSLEQWKLQDELIGIQRTAVDHGEDRTAALQKALESMRARGSLPVGALAAAFEAGLQAPMEDLFSTYTQARAEWPHAAAHELVEYVPTEAPPHLRLQDWLGDLRRNDDGQRCRLVISSTGLVKDKRYRYDKLMPHWVLHLAGHLQGEPMTTRVLSKAGHVTLPELDIEAARRHWDALVWSLHDGLASPQPLALRSAVSWISAANEAAAYEAARKCYEVEPGAERTQDPYLLRAYPTFEALWCNGGFAELAGLLLAPLRDTVKAPS